ncbi:ubiquitin-protein transferase activating protein [Allomyces arbusculus]|nr:ubiquitin-protein transferase activating protein [Allomyces arbusculus]
MPVRRLAPRSAMLDALRPPYSPAATLSASPARALIKARLPVDAAAHHHGLAPRAPSDRPSTPSRPAVFPSCGKDMDSLLRKVPVLMDVLGFRDDNDARVAPIRFHKPTPHDRASVVHQIMAQPARPSPDLWPLLDPEPTFSPFTHLALPDGVTPHVMGHLASNPCKILDAPGFAADLGPNRVAWSAHNVLAIALGDRAYLWDHGTVHALDPGLPDRPHVSAVAFHPAGSTLAIATAHGSLNMYDVDSQTRTRFVTANETQSAIHAMDWTARYLATGDATGAVKLWDERWSGMREKLALQVPPSPFQTTKPPSGPAMHVQFAPDKEVHLATATREELALWDLRRTDRALAWISAAEYGATQIDSVAWCPWQNNLIALACSNSSGSLLVAWTLATRETVATFTHPSLRTTALTFGPDDQLLLASHHTPPPPKAPTWTRPQPGSFLAGYEFPSLRPQWHNEYAHDGPVMSAAIAPSGMRLATAAPDENVKLWRVRDCDARRNEMMAPPMRVVDGYRPWMAAVPHASSEMAADDETPQPAPAPAMDLDGGRGVRAGDGDDTEYEPPWPLAAATAVESSTGTLPPSPSPSPSPFGSWQSTVEPVIVSGLSQPNHARFEVVAAGTGHALGY